MVVRVGHYYFDNKPIIGKIVDFNMWDRCKQYRYNKRIYETEHLEFWSQKSWHFTLTVQNTQQNLATLSIQKKRQRYRRIHANKYLKLKVSVLFQITGSLIKRIEVPVTEASCSRKNQRRALSIPIPYLSWFDAKRTCDKFVECNYYNYYDYPLLPRFLANSMLGPFGDYDDWLDFFSQQKTSPAMLKECETGGRYLHWIGYRLDDVHTGNYFLA